MLYLLYNIYYMYVDHQVITKGLLRAYKGATDKKRTRFEGNMNLAK